MHHFSQTYIVEIGTGGIILFVKNAPNLMVCGAKYSINGAGLVQILKTGFAGVNGKWIENSNVKGLIIT
jgi:hypothetical protein